MNNNLYLLMEKYILEKRKKNLSNHTIELEERAILSFFKFLASHYSISDVREIKKEHINSYYDYIQSYKKIDGNPLSHSFKYSIARTLFSWLNFLVDNEYIFLNPIKEIGFEPPNRFLPKNVLSEDEICLLLETPNIKTFTGLRDRTILELLYGSALRSSELRNLKLHDLDLENCFIFVSGKGSKDRVVPITRTARRFIKKYLQKSRLSFTSKNPSIEYLFTNFSGGKMSMLTLSRIIRKYVVKAGIQKKITPHTLRHTCATHLIARGASVRYVQELLGHSCIMTTQIYTHIMPVNLKEVYLKTHPRALQGLTTELEDKNRKVK